jgi:hypothetical protein
MKTRHVTQRRFYSQYHLDAVAGAGLRSPSLIQVKKALVRDFYVFRGEPWSAITEGGRQ